MLVYFHTFPFSTFLWLNSKTQICNSGKKKKQLQKRGQRATYARGPFLLSERFRGALRAAGKVTHSALAEIILVFVSVIYLGAGQI